MHALDRSQRASIHPSEQAIWAMPAAALRAGGPAAVAAHAEGIAAALGRADGAAAEDGLEVAARADRMAAVLAAAPGGQHLPDLLAAAWQPPRAAAVGAALSERGTAELLAALAHGGHAAATAALLACLGGRAPAALLAHDALAVRAGAEQTPILRLLFAPLGVAGRAQALASGRGQLIASLLRRHDAEVDAALGGWLEEVVQAGRPEWAERLLEGASNLLPVALAGRRLPEVLGRLLVLAGPAYASLLARARAASPGPR